MRFLRRLQKVVAVVTAAAFFVAIAPLPAAQAALIGTDQVIDRMAAEDARAKVNGFLSRDDVRQQMQSLGVSPEEAKARVASLSDAEVARVAGKLETMPAGQGAAGIIIGVAVITVVVLIITDILGFTNVFSFINKGGATR